MPPVHRNAVACFSLVSLIALGAFWPASAADPGDGGETWILRETMHLRSGGEREWSVYPMHADAVELTARFLAEPNDQPCTLCLRQEDVKQSWRVLVNETFVAELTRDENPQWTWLELPARVLVEGENVLRVAPQGEAPSDDIRVGPIRMIPRALSGSLAEARVAIRVLDKDGGQPLPSRITIVDAEGTLHPVSADPAPTLAVRTGVIDTSTGEAELRLPAGRYIVYAGRGFEYSLAETALELSAGDDVATTLSIRREVPTSGWVACDPHIHTLTFSGHGDATIAERMVTIAAEGIELPVSTEHNAHIDYEPPAAEAGVRRYFTPVMGNELTTPVGHFNIFPIDAGSRVPEHRLESWGPVFDEIFATPGVRVAILNHARDLHSGVRPFGPEHFNEAAGTSLDGWPYRMNGMEVVNSGAVQSEPLQLVEDWMTLLNAGVPLAPVGSSDSHDVARHFVGQARTYLRCDDADPSQIDVDAAVESFLHGRVMVSYGLLAEIVVDGRSGPGDLAVGSAEAYRAAIRVLAPHWSEVSEVRLYANGELFKVIKRNGDIAGALEPGVRWQGEFSVPRREQDQHLVAVAIGPGIRRLYWPTAKPYQPTSPDWEPRTLGISGAVFLDNDADGTFTPARDYAQRVFTAAQGRLDDLIDRLAAYDAATATQAAALYHAAGGDLRSAGFQKGMTSGPEPVQSGFQRYFAAWRDTELARTKR